MSNLLRERLSLINVGLPAFAQSVAAAGSPVSLIDWIPPAGGDAEAARSLAALFHHPLVEAANQDAFQRYLAATPSLVGIGPAAEAIPDFGERTILHAGPPIEWTEMCGPMQGAIIGAVLYEGWAATPNAAAQLAANGAVDFAPAHHYAAVGPMAGVISPTMPVWQVENTAQGNVAYSNLNEGLGKVLRFGAYGPPVIERLRWMADVLAPGLRTALAILGPIELKPLMAQALHMGDEVHNRNVAASSLFLKRLLPGLLRTDVARTTVAAIVEFIASNDHFFLNLSMAGCKAMLDAAHGVPLSTMVTAMARNGVHFGIRVSGLGSRWVTAPAPVVDGLFFPGYSTSDAAPDLGDSAITETAGIGGFAMAAAPAIARFVGGSPQDALAYTREMAVITLGDNPAFTLPPLDFAATPAGIDLRLVLDTNIAPVINTGIAHREAGVGQIGAGITRAPIACFAQAARALAAELAQPTTEKAIP